MSPQPPEKEKGPVFFLKEAGVFASVRRPSLSPFDDIDRAPREKSSLFDIDRPAGELD